MYLVNLGVLAINFGLDKMSFKNSKALTRHQEVLLEPFGHKVVLKRFRICLLFYLFRIGDLSRIVGLPLFLKNLKKAVEFSSEIL